MRTLREIAQGLVDEGRINMPAQLAKVDVELYGMKYAAKWLSIEQMHDCRFAGILELRRIVAIALLDGSIVLDDPNPWRLITDEQRSATVDDDLHVTNGQYQAIAHNHSGTWEVGFGWMDLEFTPTHWCYPKQPPKEIE